MTSANIDLVKVRDSSVSRGRRDVFELDVHVVLGCTGHTLAGNEQWEESAQMVVYTFEKLAAIDLAGGKLKRYDMALHSVSMALRRAFLRVRKTIVLTWASFSSLMGMPIVDVSFPMLAVAF